MGIAQMKKKDYDAAYRSFSDAIKVNPNFAEAYLNRGSCQEMQRKFEEAVADWREAYKLGITKARNYISFYE